MTTDDAVNVLVPMPGLRELSVPPLAVTDGSADPTWIDVPCTGTYVYGRKRTLRLPFDAATADAVQRRISFERRVRTVWAPISMVLMLAALATLYLPGDDRRLDLWLTVFLAAGSGVSF